MRTLQEIAKAHHSGYLLIFIILVLIFQEYIVAILFGIWIVYYFSFLKDRKFNLKE